MIKEITFHAAQTFEERKMAINNALAAHAPFELKKMVMQVPGFPPMDYTGAYTMTRLATAATIEFKKP